MISTPHVVKYLNDRQIAFKRIEYPLTSTPEQVVAALSIPLHALLKATILKYSDGLVIAVCPADRHIDFTAIPRHFADDVQLADPSTIACFFSGHGLNTIPPIGHLFGLPVLLDMHCEDAAEVLFSDGSGEALIRMAYGDFRTVLENAMVADYTRPTSDLLSNREMANEPEGVSRIHPLSDIRERVSEIERLPAMPEMAQQLLQLRRDADCDISDMVAVVGQDPSLAAQIVRYARSPFFGYAGEVGTLQDAITRVLGFDMVMNIALGVATGKIFRNPRKGPLGLEAFWRHAVYTATLGEALAKRLDSRQRPRVGTTYLCGLLHNFGFLLLGHFFPAQFTLLNKLVENNPDKAVQEIEKLVLGIDHCELGAVLMHSWNLPGEVIATVRYHHDPTYAGNHALQVRLIYVANRLLHEYRIGDEAYTEIAPRLLDGLGLRREQLDEALSALWGHRDALEVMADQIAA
jgi:HD-like signal output (HDOD) protein/prolyl-tRNA editing enzyme YbaK/EbsC (Cys-tRNA(Pro) deacylase)